MSLLQSSKLVKCAEIGQSVRIDQSEGECRSKHGCEQALCPLARDFEADKLDFLLAMTGSRIHSTR